MPVVTNPVALGAATKKSHYDTAFNWAVPTIAEKSGDYTMLDVKGCELVKVTTAAALITVTLPTLADNQGSRVIVVKDKDSGVGEVMVDGEGAELLMYPGFTAAVGYVGLAGQSVEFVGMADGWQHVSGVVQPVAGEPSWGTLHPHKATIINAANHSGAGWTTVDISAQVPVGTKVIYCRLQITSSVAGEYVIMADTSARAGTFELVQYTQLANGAINLCGYLTLSPTYTFDWYASNAVLTVVDAIMQGYMG
ncbi:MAG: hypothetical protein IMZ71_02755 [Chloroflexi bacterium]|nr:hypothetical protein [Chloroflexota bacterium]